MECQDCQYKEFITINIDKAEDSYIETYCMGCGVHVSSLKYSLIRSNTNGVRYNNNANKNS